MSGLNYLFVINPISGGNDKSLIYRFIEDEKQGLGFSYEIYNTTAIDDEAVISKVVVGGDGTLLLVAKILQNTSIKIGLMPFGSANGMSRELNIPKISDIKLSLNPSDRFRDCWRVIQRENIKELNLLQINDNHYALHPNTQHVDGSETNKAAVRIKVEVPVYKDSKNTISVGTQFKIEHEYQQ